MVQNGIFTRNEVRRTFNYPLIAGADELTAQVNMAPLDKLGQPQPSPTPSDQPQQPPIRNSYGLKPKGEPKLLIQ
jgi:hypothetical protein